VSSRHVTALTTSTQRLTPKILTREVEEFTGARTAQFSVTVGWLTGRTSGLPAVKFCYICIKVLLMKLLVYLVSPIVTMKQ